VPTTKSTLFAVSKDKWHTKEDTGKSIKNALCVLRYAKRYLNVKLYKPVDLGIVELCLSEGIRQLVSKSVSQSVKNSVKF